MTKRSEPMEDGELLAVISELVLGYREGKSGDILQAIARLKTKAMNYELNSKVADLAGAIDELHALKEEIMVGA